MQVGQISNVDSRGRWKRSLERISCFPVTTSQRCEAAFTLLELMMVVAIIGLMMTMGVPAILRTMHQEPLRRAVNDVMTICSHARAQAILHGVTTSVVFHPRSREIELVGVADTNSVDGAISSDDSTGKTKTSSADTSSLNSAQFADSINIDMLDVNLLEYKDAPEARVRFFPNGTSDELTLILNSGDQYREISLEVTTGLASLQVIR